MFEKNDIVDMTDIDAAFDAIFGDDWLPSLDDEVSGMLYART